MTVDGNVGVDNLLHTLAKFMHVVRGDLYLSTLFLYPLNIHKVAIADGDVYDYAAAWPEVVGGL